jgi:hypothetical protein
MPLSFRNRSTFNLLPSAARTDHTATGSALRKVNSSYAGLRLTIDITAFTGTSITFTIQGVDPVGATDTYTLLASAALAATGVTSLLIYPGCVAAANLVANIVLPELWQVTATGTITSVTYSLRAELIP